MTMITHGNNGIPSQAPELTNLLPRLQALLQFSQPCLKLSKILVPLDFSESSLRSLPCAALLARQFGCAVALLHVVHLNIVGEEQGVPLARFLEEMKLEAERLLQETVSSSSLTTARVVVRAGEPAATILQEAAESHADLIIIGRHQRRGLGRLISPSVGKKIIRRAPCPVLVAP